MTRRSWAARRSMTAILVAVILLAGLATTAAVVTASSRGLQERRQEVMDQRAQVVGNAVTAQVRRYTDTISDLAVAVGAQSHLSADDYVSLTSRMNRQQLPGATGAGLVVAATDGDVARVQAHWRALGASDLTLHPVGRQREHLFVVLNNNLIPPAPATGADLSQADQPTQAMLLARNHAQVTASSTYVLLRDRGLPKADQQLSFVLVAPVYGGAGTPWVGRFEGWIVMGLRGGDFIAQTMQAVSQRTVAVTLFDTSTPTSASMAVARQAAGQVLPQQRYRRYVNVEVGGRTWQLLVQPTASLFATMSPSPAAELGAAGISVTLLLALLVAILSISRDRALRMVARATAALRADITRREAVEMRLREREIELEAFAGVVAHDLKSPLTGIAGYADIVAERHGPQLDDLGRRCVEKIISGSARMRSLIDDLLAYAAARDSTLNRQLLQLGDVVHDVLAERIDVGTEPPALEIGPLPMVVADPALLRQVIDNLIGNALKYVRPGDVPYVSVTAIPVTIGWRIEVADRGIGITDDDRARVFDTFHRVRGSEGYSGTGLGLAICRRVIERHGGQIGVDADPGGGSRFWFVLPHVGSPDVRPASGEARNAVGGHLTSDPAVAPVP